MPTSYYLNTYLSSNIHHITTYRVFLYFLLTPYLYFLLWLRPRKTSSSFDKLIKSPFVLLSVILRSCLVTLSLFKNLFKISWLCLLTIFWILPLFSLGKSFPCWTPSFATIIASGCSAFSHKFFNQNNAYFLSVFRNPEKLHFQSYPYPVPGTFCL